MKVLCVAEKPSISKSISQILSGGQFTTRNTATNYVKNYDFNYPQTNSQFTVTCVAGHLMHHDFAESHRKWHTCDPFALFEAPIVDDVASDKKSIARNLSAEAKKVQQLMIWTDCDREGENIGAEIAKICRQANRNITVKRARFSAIIAQQIHHAAQHPVELDMAQAAAVDARIILDLRIGAAFTRMQTKSLQQTFPQISEVVSYGPCQYPTLGFVVSRYKQVKLFVPEKFWFIYLAITRDAEDDSEEVPFTWKHGHVYEEIICQIRLEDALLNETARVTRVTKKDTKKWKPLPLTTVELQKAGSRILKLAPKKILDIAEKLYQNGFLSYPRTETDQFDPQFDFMSLIGKQTVDPAWGQYATGLQNGGFANPRRGKNNDQAHPPIHPTAHAGNIAGDDKRVYEFITRRFLACCSKDALGFQTTVDIVYGREEFSATGLIVLERNYLDVYPYDKWSTKELPDFQEGEEFVPSICELREGQTSKPSLLTEADLVGLMDKNGIGTDATIAQHIETIIDREYVIARMEGATKYLVPSSLGMGLIEGYNAIGFDRSLSKPQLRRMTERAMVEICQGTKEKIDMLEENIEQYKDMFIKARAEFPKVTASVRRYLERQGQVANNANGRGRGGGAAGRGGRGRGGRGGGGGRGAGGRNNDDDDSSDGGDGGGGAGAGRGARGRGRGATRAAPIAAPPRSRRANPPPAPPPAPPSAPAPIPTTGQGYIEADDDDMWDALDAVSTAPPPPHPPPPPPPAPRPASRPAPTPVSAPAPSSRPPPSRQADPKPASRSLSTSTPGASSSRLSSTAVSEQPEIFCWCASPAAQLTVSKDGPNKGRSFRKCGKPRDSGDQCEFWQWVDEEGSSTANTPVSSVIPTKRAYSQVTTGGAEGEPRRCECDLTAIVKMVTKDGPNKGKSFWCCPSSKQAQCKFFAWDDGSGATIPVAAGRSESMETRQSQGTGGCFRCGQEGHWANACPNEGSSGNKRSKTSTKQGATGVQCFKCNQEGHYSRDCPGEGGEGGGGKQRRSSSTRGSSKRGRGGRGKGKSTRGRAKTSSGFAAVDDF